MSGPPQPAAVLTLADVGAAFPAAWLGARGLETVMLEAGADIPGSFWGAPEAGLVGHSLYVRPDTPVHSALHEAAHYLCMSEDRRARLERDAGGTFAEEDAVCYLQVVLAGSVAGMGRARMLADMDAWGYTFRLGSARRWFEEDAADARAWLVARGILDPAGALR